MSGARGAESDLESKRSSLPTAQSRELFQAWDNAVLAYESVEGYVARALTDKTTLLQSVATTSLPTFKTQIKKLLDNPELYNESGLAGILNKIAGVDLDGQSAQFATYGAGILVPQIAATATTFLRQLVSYAKKRRQGDGKNPVPIMSAADVPQGFSCKSLSMVMLVNFCFQVEDKEINSDDAIEIINRIKAQLYPQKRSVSPKGAEQKEESTEKKAETIDPFQQAFFNLAEVAMKNILASKQKFETSVSVSISLDSHPLTKEKQTLSQPRKKSIKFKAKLAELKTQCDEAVKLATQKLEAKFTASLADMKIEYKNISARENIINCKDALELYITQCASAKYKWIGGGGGALIKAGLCIGAATGCLAIGLSGPVGWVLGGVCLLGFLHCVRKSRKENKKIELLSSIDERLKSLEFPNGRDKKKEDGDLDNLQFISHVRLFVNKLKDRCDDSSASMKCLEKIESILKGNADNLKQELLDQVDELKTSEQWPHRGFRLFSSIDHQFVSQARVFLSNLIQASQPVMTVVPVPG